MYGINSIDSTETGFFWTNHPAVRPLWQRMMLLSRRYITDSALPAQKRAQEKYKPVALRRNAGS